MHWVENKACRTSDFIISNWPYAIEYLKEKGVDSSRFLWLPNGFDMEEFKSAELLSSSLKNKLPKDKFIIGYTGTLGRIKRYKYNIRCRQITKASTRYSFCYSRQMEG